MLSSGRPVMDTLQIQHVVHWGSNTSEDNAKPTVTNDPWRRSTTWEPLQRTRTEHSGRVQRKVKFKTTSTKFQEHTTNMLCYDPQLQGYFIWHCHLSHDPLAATSLDHRCTLVQVTYNTFKSSATSCRNIPKTEQWKTVDKLNCKTMTTVKTVAYIVQWVHMCPTVRKWHPTSYKRKQLTSNPKQWNEHHMNWHHKTWKIQNCCNCQTPTKIYAQLLQDSWTASANRTGQFLLFLGQFLQWKRVHQATKCKQMQNNWCIQVQKTCNQVQMTCNQVQMTCNQVQMTCNPLFWLSAARLCTLGYSWVNLEAVTTYSPSYAHSRCSFSQTKS